MVGVPPSHALELIAGKSKESRDSIALGAAQRREVASDRIYRIKLAVMRV